MSETTQLQGRELDRVLAKTLGCNVISVLDGFSICGCRDTEGYTGAHAYYRGGTLKRYHDDLNAMHDVEAELERRGLRPQYARALIDSMGLNDKMRVERDALEADPPFFGFDCVWYPAHATAEQKARAALAVLSKQG